jgi:ABC-type histidine transport system ATPase subunit
MKCLITLPHPRRSGCRPFQDAVSDTDVAIEIVDMHKWYGDFHVLRDINLKVMRGERIVICGPSGSGKSTMIRCINRLEEHQKGQIIVDGIELTDDLKKIDEIRREVGMVFQHFNLFPHLTILENCTLAPIWVRKMPKKEAEERDALPRAGQDPRAGATSIPASFPAASSSAWRLPGRCA